MIDGLASPELIGIVGVLVMLLFLTLGIPTMPISSGLANPSIIAWAGAAAAGYAGTAAS